MAETFKSDERFLQIAERTLLANEIIGFVATLAGKNIPSDSAELFRLLNNLMKLENMLELLPFTSQDLSLLNISSSELYDVNTGFDGFCDYLQNHYNLQLKGRLKRLYREYQRHFLEHSSHK